MGRHDQVLKRHVLPRWGARDAISITRRDVLDLLDDMVDQGDVLAALPRTGIYVLSTTRGD